VEACVNLAAPAPLGPHHDRRGFACGMPALDRWLGAAAVMAGRKAATFVACDGGRVAGYYTLSAASLRTAGAPLAIRRNAPVPVLKLGRLAVDGPMQRRGLATALLLDAFARSYAVSRHTPVAALIVDVPDTAAGKWFGQYGFRPVPADPTTMFVALSTIEALVDRTGNDADGG
jgi:GNAT superfamily N-acetyltransferase